MSTRKGVGQIPGLGVLITFEQVFSQKARHTDLLNYIGHFPMPNIVGTLCGIGAILHNSTESTPFPIQMRFATEFAKGVPFMSRVVEILAEERDAIFVHYEQLSVLIKYALLDANASAWPPSEAADLLMRLLLVYNSLHGKEFEPTPGDRESFMRFELRSVFNFEEHLGHVIRRYYKFLEWARTSPEALASANHLDLDKDFQKYYGMTPSEWSASAFCILSYFRQITDATALERIKPVLDTNEYFAHMATGAPVRRWVALNSINVSEAREYYHGAPDSYSGLPTLLPFMRHPLLSLGNGYVCVPFLPYLEASLGSGLYFAMFDAYKQTGGDKMALKFTRFFGEFFETYIVSLVKAMHPTPENVFGEIRDYEPGKKSTDLVIFEDDTALFIDIVASRFNVTKSLIALDPDAIRVDVEKLVIANAIQMDKSIAAFRDGRLAYPGIDRNSIATIRPIVLTIQLVPRAFEFNRRVLSEIRNRKLLEGVEPLEILTAEDIEGFKGLYDVGVLLSDVFARKAAHVHPKARNDSLKNYLYFFETDTLRKEKPRTHDPNDDPWLQSVLDLVRRWLPVVTG